jgi:hypothetical protein
LALDARRLGMTATKKNVRVSVYNSAIGAPPAQIAYRVIWSAQVVLAHPRPGVLE